MQAGIEAAWTRWDCSISDEGHLARASHLEIDVSTALRFTDRSDEQEEWVLERSILYAAHLFEIAGEHALHRRSVDSRRFADPAIALLEQVRSSNASLPQAAVRMAREGLPEMALPLLGLDRRGLRTVPRSFAGPA